MMRHFVWIEGLPGAGKSFIIYKLTELFGKRAVAIPSVDLKTLFSKTPAFLPFRFGNPSSRAHALLEIARRLTLSELDALPEFIFIERSWISIQIFQQVAHRLYGESLLDESFLCQWKSIELKGKETTLIIETDPITSMERDKETVTTYWSDEHFVKEAHHEYLQLLEKNKSIHHIDGRTHPEKILENCLHCIS
jgi:thymidylate kinase